MKTSRGITVVELLVAMTVFMIILGAALTFMTGTQRTTSQQSVQAQASLTTRLAFLRMGELIAQSAYIYPANQTITAGGRSYTTGATALALLIAKGTTYCPGNPKTYCAVLFSTEDRTPFKTMLGENSTATSTVLVERKFQANSADPGVLWAQSTSPPTSWVGAATSTGVLADSVDTALTSLGAAAQLTLGSGVGYDKQDTFVRAGQTPAATTTDARALIQSAQPTLALRFNLRQPVKTQESTFLLSHAIPRGALPNPEKP